MIDKNLHWLLIANFAILETAQLRYSLSKMIDYLICIQVSTLIQLKIVKEARKKNCVESPEIESLQKANLFDVKIISLTPGDTNFWIVFTPHHIILFVSSMVS